MTLIIFSYISNPSIRNILNSVTKKRGKKRWLLKNLRLRKCKVNKIGRPRLKISDEERQKRKRLSSNLSRMKNYNRKRDKDLKDIDKTLSTLTKEEMVKALKRFFSTHYQFNFFISLQSGFNLDKRDSKLSKNKEEYQFLRQQDKYQIATSITLKTCMKRTNEFLNLLRNKDGNLIYDNYVVGYHKGKYDNTFHSHIAINIVDKSVKNIHTFCYNRWKYCKRKKQMVKKVYNSKECIGYMLEEKKRFESDFVEWDTNINCSANRLVTQFDLVDDYDYAVKNYSHPLTQEKLIKYGIPSKRIA